MASKNDALFFSPTPIHNSRLSEGRPRLAVVVAAVLRPHGDVLALAHALEQVVRDALAGAARRLLPGLLVRGGARRRAGGRAVVRDDGLRGGEHGGVLLHHVLAARVAAGDEQVLDALRAAGHRLGERADRGPIELAVVLAVHAVADVVTGEHEARRRLATLLGGRPLLGDLRQLVARVGAGVLEHVGDLLRLLTGQAQREREGLGAVGGAQVLAVDGVVLHGVLHHGHVRAAPLEGVRLERRAVRFAVVHRDEEHLVVRPRRPTRRRRRRLGSGRRARAARHVQLPAHLERVGVAGERGVLRRVRFDQRLGRDAEPLGDLRHRVTRVDRHVVAGGGGGGGERRGTGADGVGHGRKASRRERQCSTISPLNASSRRGNFLSLGETECSPLLRPRADQRWHDRVVAFTHVRPGRQDTLYPPRSMPQRGPPAVRYAV